MIVFKGSEMACPFCGRQFAVGTKPQAILHAVPTCETFDRLDALDFLRAANAKLAAEERS